MDTRIDVEMTKEQRSLLNAGHGPPIPQGPPMAFGIYNSTVRTPATSAFHRNVTCSDFGSRVVVSPGFYGDGRYQQMFLNRPEIADGPIQTSSGQKLLDDLARDNDELHRRLTAKIFELESLRTKYERDLANYQRLTKALTSLPDTTVRLPPTNEPGDFIHLVACGDVACGHSMANTGPNLDEYVSMTKSVQCSEPSMEQVTDGKGETKELEIASPVIQKKGGGISSSSSSSESFEVVGQGSCLGSPAEKENVELPSMSMKAELEALRSRVSELSRKLEAEVEERKRENTELNEKINQISQKEEKVNGKVSAVTPADRQSEDQRQNVSELMSANWKLTEQNLELTRENEDLKKKELDWRSAIFNVNQLEEELQRKRQRVMEAEMQLESQHQLIQQLEAQIRDVEHTRLAESFEQKGMAFSGSASGLATENSLLKHQIEAYKEDFEVERKDREKLIAQKDTLQRCFETLRSDLDVARQQLKKYESDITLLRIDNNTLRTKLRSVTEEVEALRETRQSTTSAPKASAPPAQNRTFVPQPLSQNTFALQKPSPPPSAPSGDWECQACTFKNPAPRTFCEMCGTHEPLRMSSAAQVPNCTYVPNIPVRELPPGQWNVAQPAKPLLSNLRNYGDIETD